MVEGTTESTSCETPSKTRAKIDEAIARTAMLKEANFYPKLFGQVEEIEADKVQEFEESLNKYLEPYLENALKTGWLIGNIKKCRGKESDLDFKVMK